MILNKFIFKSYFVRSKFIHFHIHKTYEYGGLGQRHVYNLLIIIIKILNWSGSLVAVESSSLTKISENGGTEWEGGAGIPGILPAN